MSAAVSPCISHPDRVSRLHQSGGGGVARPSGLDRAYATLSQISLNASSAMDEAQKKAFGAYLTPAPLAKLIATMCDRNLDGDIVIGDHGAGSGLLSCLTAASMVEKASSSSQIGVGAYEVQPQLQEYFRQSVAALAPVMRAAGKNFFYSLSGDFLADIGPVLDGQRRDLTHAVINPPYFKLSPSHPANALLKDRLGFTVPNIYALFCVLTLLRLKPGAEMVALIPRSFASGRYFEGFRKFLSTAGSITTIVRFASRSNLFKGDNVLQENVVLKMRAAAPQDETIRIIAKDTPESALADHFEMAAGELLGQGTIAMPATTDEVAALRYIRSLPITSGDIGLSVSTGKLIEHRHRPYLKAEGNGIPYLHARHFCGGEKLVRRPAPAGFPNIVEEHAGIDVALVPASPCIVAKRISPNDGGNQRFVGTIVDEGDFHEPRVAFSNGLQVLQLQRASGRGCLLGLYRFLASPILQDYIRATNGTTQLNKADLEGLRFPRALTQ